MEVVWQPDPKNAYLSSGTDNLALHETPGGRPRPPPPHPSTTWASSSPTSTASGT